ncbi:hypothetical protein T01_16035 [Trichinella spiralis]|uniref:Uncharacterized protein n=1 Tax=Trichinella spiralis TaxID=6334 RepID=A0A0V1B5V5_TRISP|nr:hypothetical protein T01_16035 [Trichinella spiralis]
MLDISDSETHTPRLSALSGSQSVVTNKLLHRASIAQIDGDKVARANGYSAKADLGFGTGQKATATTLRTHRSKHTPVEEDHFPSELHIRPLYQAGGWRTTPMDTRQNCKQTNRQIESQLYLPLMRSLLGSCVDGRLKIHFNRSEFFNGFAKRCTFTYSGNNVGYNRPNSICKLSAFLIVSNR